MIRSAVLPLRINIKSTVLPVSTPPETDTNCHKHGLEKEQVAEAGAAAGQSEDSDDSGSSESLTSTIISTTQHLPERGSDAGHKSKNKKRKKDKKSSRSKKKKRKKSESNDHKSKRKRGDEETSSDEESSSWSQVFRKKAKSKSSGSSSWYDLPADVISDPKTEAVRDWIQHSHVPAVDTEQLSVPEEANHRPSHRSRSNDNNFKWPDDSFKKPALPSFRHDRQDEYERRHRHQHDDRDRRSPERWASRDREKDRWHRNRDRSHGDYHRSVSVARSTRSVSRARRIYTEEEKIDKAKLLAIARANLSRMMSMGALPKGVDVERFKLRHLKELATSKSVKEYTEFCRAISAMEAAAYSDSSLSGSDDSDDEVRSVISEATFAAKHPFALKERKEIQIKVRDFVPRMPRSAKEIQSVLLEEFPVDSGDKHRRKQLEWTDVTDSTTPTSLPVKEKYTGKKQAGKAKEQPDDSLAFRKETTTTETTSSSSEVVREGVRPEAEVAANLDVGSIMSQRLSAMRVLQTDPFNVVALKQMSEAQEMMQAWSKSSVKPGQFTGSTQVRPMSQQELNAGQSAWVHKDTLKNTKAIRGGIGRHLMEKMGWREGQGLGAKQQGSLIPILPSIKLDTKGLATQGETVKSLAQQVVADLPLSEADRVPVAMLHSYCMERHYSIPLYELVEESGPSHKKQFVMRVLVNEIFYQPTVSSPTKKQAKHLAATVCLQAFGLLPKEPPKVQLMIESQQ